MQKRQILTGLNGEIKNRSYNQWDIIPICREAMPDASILKLGMTYPLAENLIRKFANGRNPYVVEN